MSKMAAAWLALLALTSQSALAHKLKVFAQTEGDWIHGRAYFVGGAGARGAMIEIQDAEGRVLAELAPEADGQFSYRALEPITHRLIARTGDGHQADWMIPAEALHGVFANLTPSSTPDPEAAAPSETNPPQPSPVVLLAATDPGPDLQTLDPALMAAIEQTLARQTRPLAERLNALEEHLRFQDILGGIGYILGLTGLALWWRCRRTTDRP